MMAERPPYLSGSGGCVQLDRQFACEAAQLRRARLRVVHARRQPSPVGLGSGELGLVSAPKGAEESLGILAAVLRVWRDKCPGAEVVETVTEGRPRTVLVRAAAEAGLLVVGRRVTARPAGPRIGPATPCAIHHVGCSVAVVAHS
jgi:hypothetical protein